MASDFRGAPATKALIAVCVTLTVIAASSRGVFAVSDRSSILSRGEVWRLFTSLLPSDSIGEGLLSWFLLYRFRVLERHMGTAKFTAFVLIAFVWAALANAAFVAAPFWDSGVASGPYVLIFALFVYFFSAWCQRRGGSTCELTAPPPCQERYQSCIPTTLHWRACASQTSRGSTCSAYRCVLKSVFMSAARSHSAPCAAALQQRAALHRTRAHGRRIRPAVHVRRAAHRVVAPGESGGGGGRLHRRCRNAPRLPRPPTRQFPRAARASVLARTLSALIDPHLPSMPPAPAAPPEPTAPPHRAGLPLDAGEAAAAAAAGGAGGAQHQQQLPTPEPDPAAVERLCAMGFGRAEAEAALRAAFNDEPTAVNRLLG